MSKKLFDFAIGNPPYQESQDSTSDKPVYNFLLEAAYEVCDKAEFITPARFLFNAGKTPKAWNEKMLNDEHLKVMFYEQNSSKIFSNTEIKGGIAITYRDGNKEYGAIEHFVPSETLRNILTKVKNSNGFSPITPIINSTEHFKLSEQLYVDHPEYLSETINVRGKVVPLISKGHEYDLTSNILDKNRRMFFENIPDRAHEYIRVFGRRDGKRACLYLRKKYITYNDGLESYKVVVPESNNNGTFGETLVDPFVADKDVVTTQTFITMGFCKTRQEAESLLKYIKGKFARAMLGTLKITQHNKRETWKYVPLQDFTENSDIDWTKSVHEIDLQLYRKYGLSVDEINFIEENVKEMV